MKKPKLSSAFQRRNMLLTFIILTLVINVAPVIMLASGDGVALLAVDPLSTVDTGLTPGSPFAIVLTVDDVENMFGYQLRVVYNTSVLTATDFVSFAPFTLAQGDPPGGYIDDDEGFVEIVYSYPMGEQEGLTTADPYQIAGIVFTVDDWGWSTLHLCGPPPANVSKIPDVFGGSISHELVDGFFANVVDFPHDVAVTGINVSPTRDITPGESVSIDVTVANQAPFTETFTLTAYADSTAVDSTSVTLAPMRSNVTQLTWDTTGFAFGHYNVRAEASVVPDETDTDDNTLAFDDIVIVGIHDVAVSAVTATPASVVFGETVSVDVTVANQGNFMESFDVTARYGYENPWIPDVTGEFIINTYPVTSMAGGTIKILTFTLDTSDIQFPNGVTDLWIEANVSKAGEPAVPYETNTANNKMKVDVTVWKEPATLKAPLVMNPSLTPGQAFSINITIANVENVLTYEFFLYYNTTLLNATSLTSYSPFTKQVQSTINNAEGWIYMKYATPNSTTTLSTVDPKPIARIDFTVTDVGECLLDIRDPKIKDAQERYVALTIVDGNFRNFLHQHDLSVSLETPSRIYLGDSSQLNVTVYNYGLSDETNVELQLLINGTLEDSLTIPNLSSQESYTWNYNWTPSVVGLYNITAYAPPVAGEVETVYNKATGMVRVQLIKPTARFTISPGILLAGGTVTFDASTSSSEGTTITSYKWDFDDGNVTEVTVPIITHIYTENGTYTVSLNVTDGRGVSTITEKQVTVYKRDIAVVSVVPSSTQVAVGETVSINVTVINQGDYSAETFDVIAYYDDTIIETKTGITLSPGATTTLTFDWDTTEVDDSTYTIKAEATVVPNEIDTANNFGTVEVTVGEAEGDGDGAGQDYTLYILAAVVAVVVAATLIYLFIIRKPKTP